MHRRDGNRRLLWTYTHVPSGSTEDRSEAIAAQIERFAPGFRDTVVDTHVTTAQGLEAYNRSSLGRATSWRQSWAPPVMSPPRKLRL